MIFWIYLGFKKSLENLPRKNNVKRNQRVRLIKQSVRLGNNLVHFIFVNEHSPTRKKYNIILDQIEDDD